VRLQLTFPITLLGIDARIERLHRTAFPVPERPNVGRRERAEIGSATIAHVDLTQGSVLKLFNGYPPVAAADIFTNREEAETICRFEM
jgi:hypothetical protein